MSCNNCNQKIDCDCKVVKSGDCDGLCDLITKKVDNHINATNMLDVCNKNFISDFFRWSIAHAMNVSCVLKNLKNQICSLWSLMNMLVVNGYMPVTKNYTYTVPKAKFEDTSGKNAIQWSGSPDAGECYIDIPVAEMDIVDTVIAQPQVVGKKVHAVTVAIQSAVRVGNVYRVNFDTYEIEGNINPADPNDNLPFAVPIKFVVFGRKKISGNGFTDELC